MRWLIVFALLSSFRACALRVLGLGDRDGDGYASLAAGGPDCDDGDPAIRPGAAEVCGDGIDHDCDGHRSCHDPDCAGAPGCMEDCGNGADDDEDGLVDCGDGDCAGDAACLEDCESGVDDDGDGLVDCDDGECALDAPCYAGEDCGNGVDDDGDGLVDCDDPNCSDSCPEDCGNGVDDDADGLVDCGDGDCAGDAACQEDCANGVDDDGDGLVDCEDGECGGDRACGEQCDNGVDDDEDGLVDCEDSDCCVEEVCAGDLRCPGWFRVQVLDGGMAYQKWWTTSIGGGCVLRVWANSGVLTDLTGGTTCAFGTASVYWRKPNADRCFGGGVMVSSTGWEHGMHLSSGCPIAVKARELAPREAAGVRPDFGRRVGDPITARFGVFYRDLEQWVRPHGEVTRVGAHSVGYSYFRWMAMRFSEPATWTVRASRQ